MNVFLNPSDSVVEKVGRVFGWKTPHTSSLIAFLHKYMINKLVSEVKSDDSRELFRDIPEMEES